MSSKKFPYGYESKTVEYKRDLSSLAPVIKTIVAFANTSGGTLIIGCSSDGEIVGVSDVFQAEERLANAIADRIFPSMLPEIEATTIDGKDLLVVKVGYWKAPFYVKKEGEERGVYIRLGSTSRPAGPELLSELKRSATALSFDQEPLASLSTDGLNMEQVRDWFARVNKTIDTTKLVSLGVLSQIGRRVVPSVGGLILFGTHEARQKEVPHVRIRCARFHGVTKSAILDRMDLEGTILDAAVEVPKFIARNTRLMAEIQSMQRRDVAEYSSVVLREALINALAHADYSLSGSHIQIAIYDDRLEIQNPGMLPFGFTMEDFKSGVSRIRNKVIARVFHELQLMEEWGSGYRRIVETCFDNGCPEPKWEEFATTFRVTLYPSSLDLPSAVQRPRSDLSDREEKILSFLESKPGCRFGEIYQALSLPISERTFRYTLAGLKEKGLVVSRGKGPAAVWYTL